MGSRSEYKNEDPILQRISRYFNVLLHCTTNHHYQKRDAFHLLQLLEECLVHTITQWLVRILFLLRLVHWGGMMNGLYNKYMSYIFNSDLNCICVSCSRKVLWGTYEDDRIIKMNYLSCQFRKWMVSTFTAKLISFFVITLCMN